MSKVLATRPRVNRGATCAGFPGNASVQAGTVMACRASLPSACDRSGTVSAKDAPAGEAWRPIEVEPTGLVKLGRAFGQARAPSPSMAWLNTDTGASAPMWRTLPVGFARDAWMFLNGQIACSGRNEYFPPESRLSPDGRLEPDNALILLDLRKGRNAIILAVGNDWRSRDGAFEPSHCGWAAEAPPRSDRGSGPAPDRPRAGSRLSHEATSCARLPGREGMSACVRSRFPWLLADSG